MQTDSTIASARDTAVMKLTGPVMPIEPAFDFSGFRIFTAVPDDRDCGVVALRGMVLIYDELPLHREGVVAGALYVRESQHPRSGMTWETWLRHEREDRQSRSGPAGPLAIRREVVQAIRRPGKDGWAVRLASGHVDGPYYDWAFGTDFIGRVVGIYVPSASSEGN